MRITNVEELWYETSPYLYAVAGVVVLAAVPGALAKISGAMLLFASATILRMRWTYRRRVAAAQARVRASRQPRASGRAAST